MKSFCKLLFVLGIGRGASCYGSDGPFGKHEINLTGTLIRLPDWLHFEYTGNGVGDQNGMKTPQYSYMEGWGECGYQIIYMMEGGVKKRFEYHIPLQLYFP